MNSKYAFALVGIVLFARTAAADPFVLSDLNSTFAVNTTSSAGAFSWQVDGTEHLFNEWFWYRAGFMGRERTIDRTAANAAASVTVVASDSADADPGNDILVVTYSHPQSSTNPALAYTIQVEYDLNGAANNTGLSSLNEKVTITNYTTGNLAFHLFEYSDFNVNGTANDDTATHSGSTISQTDTTGGGATVSSIQPVPDHYQIAPVPTILNSLNNSTQTTLNDTTTNISGGGDIGFAFQWSEIIGPGSTWVIDKTKAIEGFPTAVPEPGSLFLVGSGLLALQQWQRRRTLKRNGSRVGS